MLFSPLGLFSGIYIREVMTHSLFILYLAREFPDTALPRSVLRQPIFHHYLFKPRAITMVSLKKLSVVRPALGFHI
ncbi:hypothetical protein I7I50_11588 [Histoplasma capsulatum G186AR]|uniref:Uncharacterized protein n=1 Tax=Ajellomyces capsulatus TaxID=5037 RepID=A0A8H7Z8G6_AJECA|nr:hypothetical protein I7I52_02825 [Histoplasma capsulatum]QSS70079.1 hypothetical protein I7I50_11588 [Histoplasma capsulatum G186AR]